MDRVVDQNNSESDTRLAVPQRPEPQTQLKRASARQRFAAFRTIAALMQREITTSYGRSPGGYIWAILEPVLGIALLSSIFSLGFRNPRLGTNFPIYYATGVLPYAYFGMISHKMAQAIGYSRQLLAYPRVTFIDVLTARLILNMLTQLAVACILLTGIRMAFDTRTTVVLPRILLTYAMATAFAIGVGTLNCYLTSMFILWDKFFSIVTRPLFLISGVIFLYDTIPHPYRDWLWWNPLMHVTGEMRAGFYFSYDAAYVTPSYVFAVSFVCFAMGLLLLRRYHRDIRER